jgi:hypothetical protein
VVGDLFGMALARGEGDENTPHWLVIRSSRGSGQCSPRPRYRH